MKRIQNVILASMMLLFPVTGLTNEDPNALYQKGLEAKYRLKDSLAIEHFEQAAKLGHVESQYQLAMLLLNNELRQGLEHQQSLYWLTQAAEAEHAQAQYELAMFYMDEYHNPNKEQLVEKWMSSAASLQHKEALAWIAKNSP